MIVQRYRPTATTSGGSWSGNTLRIVGARCTQVYVKTTTSTETFDVKITDVDGIPIRTFTGITDELNDLTPFPVDSVLTIAITNATEDNPFTVLLAFEESNVS